MRKFAVLLAVLVATSAWGQNPKRTTLTANAQCAVITAQNNSTIGIIVSGTWVGTLTPTLQIQGVVGAPTASTTVTPTNTTTAQGTITGNGGFKTSVGGFTQFNLCFTAFSSGSAIVDLFSTQAVNAGLLGGAAGGGGNVSGPASSTSGDVASFNGTDGKTIQDTGLAASILGLTTNRIDQNNAATTSAQFFGVISDETGSGKVVGSAAPSLTGNVVFGGVGAGNGAIVGFGNTSGSNTCTMAASGGTWACTAGWQAATLNGTTSVTGAKILTTTNCSGAGTAANPSVATCTSAAAGAFSCDVAASGGTCTVNTSAAGTNSDIQITNVASASARLSVTCNTTADTPTAPRLAAIVNGVSFTINLGTFAANPECYFFAIRN